MEKQTTAVNWLMEEIRKNTWYDNDGFPQVSLSIIDFDKAKELERQQIDDAFVDSRITYKSNSVRNSKQYFNQTFK